MHNNAAPSIGCLCITRNSVFQLERAIQCFYAQDYPNKALLVIYESDHAERYKTVVSRHKDKVEFIEIPSIPKRLLGELRNIAIDSCVEEYICQWDDDDWYASSRLSTQMNVLKANFKPACMLGYWIVYDSLEMRAYLSPFKFWEGSILCKRSILSENFRYGNLARGEDTVLLKSLLFENMLVPVISPALYIYVFHGGNTWGRDHFKRFFDTGKRLSDEYSLLVSRILSREVSVIEGSTLLHSQHMMSEIEYRFEMSDPYTFKFL